MKNQLIPNLQRARAFSLTVHLLPTEQAAWLPQLKADLETYPDKFQRLLIGGPEIAPTAAPGSGRHVHCYVQFETQRTYASVIKHLRLTGIAVFGTTAQKGDYPRIRAHHLKKETKEDEDIRLLLEYPASRQLTTLEEDDEEYQQKSKRRKTDSYEVRAAIESGDRDRVIDAMGYLPYMRMKGTIDAELHKHRKPELATKKHNIWIYGPPGTGKSASIQLLFKDLYIKNLANKTWDGYDNEPYVYLKDFDNKTLRFMTVNQLKTITDEGATPVDIKYGASSLNAHIIVCSNYSIRQCFKYKGKNAQFQDDFDAKDPDYLAIKRRFEEIHIDTWLRDHNMQLKCNAELEKAKCREDCFEPYDDTKAYSTGYDRRTASEIIDTTSTCDASTQTVDLTDETEEQTSETDSIDTTTCDSTAVLRMTAAMMAKPSGIGTNFIQQIIPNKDPRKPPAIFNIPAPK